MRKLLAMAIVAILAMGACSGNPADDPKGAFEDAIDNLSEYEGVTMTIAIDSDVDSMVALSSDGGGEPVSDEEAQKILDSSLVVSSKEGETPEDAEFEMRVNIAGNEDAIEMKVLAQDIYVRAEAAELAVETFGASPSELQAFEQQAAAQPGFEFVGSLFDGEWIKFTGAEQALGQLGAAQPTPSEEDMKALEALGESLKENTKVTAGDEEGPGSHLEVSLSLRDSYQDLVDFLEDLSTVPAGTTAGLPPESEMPDESFTIDTWVDDGRLTQVAFDVVAIAQDFGEDAPEGVDNFSIVIGLEEFTASVEAPDDAVEVDLGQLMQGMFGGLMREESTPPSLPASPGDEFCDQLEKQLVGQPKDIVDTFIQQYGEQCPNLEELEPK